MPELRSGARQPRSTPVLPAVAAPRARAETVPSSRTIPRIGEVGGAGGGTGSALPEEAVVVAPEGDRVRRRAAVAKEATVVTVRVADHGKGAWTVRVAKQAGNTKPIVQPKATVFAP